MHMCIYLCTVFYHLLLYYLETRSLIELPFQLGWLASELPRICTHFPPPSNAEVTIIYSAPTHRAISLVFHIVSIF